MRRSNDQSALLFAAQDGNAQDGNSRCGGARNGPAPCGTPRRHPCQRNAGGDPVLIEAERQERAAAAADAYASGTCGTPFADYYRADPAQGGAPDSAPLSGIPEEEGEGQTGEGQTGEGQTGEGQTGHWEGRVCLPYVNPDDPASCNYDPGTYDPGTASGTEEMGIAESREASAALALGGLLVGGWILGKAYQDFR